MPIRLTTLAALGLLAAVLPAAAASCPVKRFAPGARIEAADLNEAFGRIATAGKPFRVAYVAPSLDLPAVRGTLEGLRRKAERLGGTVEALAPRDPGSAEEQAALVTDALAKAPDMLVVTPIDSAALRSSLEAAGAGGVPAISVGLRADGARAFVGLDEARLGAAAAEFLHELYPEGTSVAEIGGPSGLPAESARAKGFADAMSFYPNVVVAGSASTDGSREKAKVAAVALLSAFPAIQGIFAHDDTMALGVLDAVKAVNRPGDVAVVGAGGTAPGWAAIKARTLRASVARFPDREGALAVEVGLRLLACQAVPPWIVSPSAVITQKSIEDYAGPSQ